MAGTVGDNPNVGQAETAAEVTAGLSASAQANIELQADAARFIMEHGVDVLDGHSPVNAPAADILEQGTGPIYDAG